MNCPNPERWCSVLLEHAVSRDRWLELGNSGQKAGGWTRTAARGAQTPVSRERLKPSEQGDTREGVQSPSEHTVLLWLERHGEAERSIRTLLESFSWEAVGSRASVAM